MGSEPADLLGARLAPARTSCATRLPAPVLPAASCFRFGSRAPLAPTGPGGSVLTSRRFSPDSTPLLAPPLDALAGPFLAGRLARNAARRPRTPARLPATAPAAAVHTDLLAGRVRAERSPTVTAAAPPRRRDRSTGCIRPGSAGTLHLPVTLFADMTLPVDRDVTAPDGSDVRILLAGHAGGLAHFEIGPHQVSVPVRHRTVEEVWYILRGTGEMWRRQGDAQSVLPLVPGVCLSIPVATAFQFRNCGDAPLSAVAVTMPPWPGAGEVEITEGPWLPTLAPGPD